MQLIDQLVSRGGATKTAPEQMSDEAQAEQAALFELDLAQLEGEAIPIPQPELRKADAPLPKPDQAHIEIAFKATPQAEPLARETISVKPDEPDMPEPSKQVVASNEIPAEVASPMPEEQPQPIAGFTSTPSQQKAPEGHEKQQPAQRVTALALEEPQQAARPIPQPANEVAKPETAIVQMQVASAPLKPAVRTEIAQTQQVPEQQVQKEVKLEQSPPKPAHRADAVIPQDVSRPEPQPIRITRAEAPSAQPTQQIVDAPKPAFTSPQPNTQHVSVEPNEPRHPMPANTPTLEAAPRSSAAQTPIQTMPQPAQIPLAVRPIEQPKLTEPEPQITLSPLQTASTLGPAPAAQATTPAQTSYAVHQITAQIAAEAGTTSSRDIEVRLDPEELGRVRITVHPREAGLFITLAVERPETLDLLRKNADELMSNLQEFDLSGATLEFSQDNDTPSPDPDPDSFDEAPILFTATPQPARTLPSGDGRLDLRL